MYISHMVSFIISTFENSSCQLIYFAKYLLHKDNLKVVRITTD